MFTFSVIVLLLAVAPNSLISQLPDYELVPDTRIGSVDDPASALSLVSLVAVAPDGRVAISQPLESGVWIFSPTGERIDQLGGAGEGPGEFRALSMLGWHGDTLWVADGSQHRVTFFPADERPVVVGAGSRRRDRFTRVPLPAPDGRWLTTREEPLDPEGLTYSEEVWLLDSEWERVRQLARFPQGRERLVLVLSQNPPAVWRLREQPFPDNPLVAISPHVTDVTVVRRGIDPTASSQMEYAVTRIGLDGDTVFHHEGAVRPQPITARAREAVIEEYVARYEEMSSPEMSGEQYITALRRALADSIRFPDFHPPVSDVVVGSDGSTWLRGPDDRSGSVRWRVLDPGGEPMRSVVTQPRLEIMAPDEDGMWAVVHDELDVPYLVRYALRRRQGPGH